MTVSEMLEYLDARMRQLRDLLDTLDLRDRREVIRGAELVLASLRSGGRLLIAGNGGSAAEAQHMAAELIGRFQRERQGIPAVALTTDSSILTSLSNDYDYSQVFSRQVAALGSPRDTLIAISTSGTSPNIVNAVEAAREIGMSTVALLGGKRCPLAQNVDVAIFMPAADAATAQEGHLLLIHVICGLVESAACSGEVEEAGRIPVPGEIR